VSIKHDGNILFLPGLQDNLFESLQFLERSRQAGADLLHKDLRHFGASATASVGKLEFDRYGRPRLAMVTNQLEIGIFELGIGKAIAEGEQRLNVFRIKPAVTHEQTFLV